MNDTAKELFANILDIINTAQHHETGVNRMMHETLVMTCHEGLKESRHGFGNLSSQVDRLCRDRHIKAADIAAIQTMRHHSNSEAPILPADLAYDCRALALFVAAVMREKIPSELTSRIPAIGRTGAKPMGATYRCIRCMVRRWDDRNITASVISSDGGGETIKIDYRGTPGYIDLSYLSTMLRQGMQLNLLDCTVKARKVVPRIIVVEPDYLLDISTIANCFDDFGHHPLVYTMNRMKNRVNTKYTLLGNFAGTALDDIINNPDYSRADEIATLRRNFQEKAMEFATCTDFDGDEFKRQAAVQIKNIKAAVKDMFTSKFDRQKAILEPTFICESLGIQGRVDLMTTDLRLLVEQKSGKNFYLQNQRPNRHGSLHVEKHYVQVLLYYGILRYNFGLSAREASIFLLYSRYPLPGGMLDVQPLVKLMAEAIRFRNQVVSTEYWIAENGFKRMLPLLNATTLNTEHTQSNLYTRYELPEINRTLQPLTTMTPTEHDYFCRMMQFVVKEQIIGKVGMQEGIGGAAADLWNMPLSEKRETGNIYTALTITKKEKSMPAGGYDVITLAVPDQGEDFLPNFRRGDMVLLYAYGRGAEPDCRRSILFKGALVEIADDHLTVNLNNGQQNAGIFEMTVRNGSANSIEWAVEHGSSDIGSTSAIHGLYNLITADRSRRDLLLGQRAPEADCSRMLSRSYSPSYDDILLKAKRANDYFLLIGPPGTGKTSLAMQFMVREALHDLDEKHDDDSALLLMSYTNRAVDEICSMLADNDIAFIRLGNRYSCDRRFRQNLLSEVVGSNATLDSIRRVIAEARVIVSTTSMLASKPFIFTIKHFALAIVDEASQILEPSIIGLLAEHTRAIGHDETSSIDKFILIGDYKQLPAVVQQAKADTAVSEPTLRAIHLDDCANSLFQRLITTENAAHRTAFTGILRRQGRMHPDIARFPNEMFYQREKLEPVPLPHQEEKNIYPIISGVDDAQDEFTQLMLHNRVIFFPSEPCRRPELSDKVNTSEAQIVVRCLQFVKKRFGKMFNAGKTVGVIVPYRNQIAMIRKEIAREHATGLDDVSIDTVERYQGSQRDVIIYSFTVQQRYQMEFLTSNCFEEDGYTIDRKLNVAITRARKQLIITGNEATLSHNAIFSKLIDECTRGKTE